jgi:hypothetical protein
MIPQLRPMNLGEILDRTFQIYRSRFFAFVGVAAIPALVMWMVHIADNSWLHLHTLVHPFRQPGTFLWNFVIGLAFYHFAALFGLIFEPALIKLTSCSILGEESSLFAALGFLAVRWRSYSWIAILKLFAQLVIPELLATGLAIGAGAVADAAGGFDGNLMWPALLIVALWVVVGFGLFLWIGACLSLALPSAALENNVGPRSLRRSWDLTRGSRGRISLVWLLVFTVSWLASLGLQRAAWYSVILLGGGWHLTVAMRTLYVPVIYMLITVLTALVGPIYPIALTLFYYDQRIRREGFDIEQMMAAAGLNPTALPPETALAAAAVPDDGAVPNGATVLDEGRA